MVCFMCGYENESERLVIGAHGAICRRCVQISAAYLAVADELPLPGARPLYPVHRWQNSWRRVCLADRVTSSLSGA